MKIKTGGNEGKKNKPPKLFYTNGILHKHHSGCAHLLSLLSHAAFYFKVCGEQHHTLATIGLNTNFLLLCWIFQGLFL